MSAIKNYFKEELQWSLLGLEHPKPVDFYLSVWQSTRSSVPLLIFRAILFLASLGIVIASLVLYAQAGIIQYWFIYLTHWGLLTIVMSTAFATVVSARVHFYGPISAEFCLPWYVKTSWVLYNITVPLAFLITIFYWSILYDSGVEEELNKGLDIAVHGLNAVVVVLLLLSCSLPTRLLHAGHALLFGLGWLVFSMVFYFAGGTDQKGNRYIYPVINWANPGPTVGLVALVALALILLHLAVIGLALLRDYTASKGWCKPSVISHLEEGTPLRQTQTQMQ